jgi:hypothetical protein
MKTEFIRLVELLNNLDELMKNLGEKKTQNQTELGLHLFMSRNYSSLKSAQYLLQQYEPAFDHALGLIFRNILTDFFLVMNIRFNTNGQEEIELVMDGYFIDSETKIDQYVALAKKCELTTVENIEKATENLNDKATISGVIREKKQSRKIDSKSIQTSAIFKNLLENPRVEDHIKKGIKNAFDLWKYYCQYEHFGLKSLEINRNVSEKMFNSRIESIISYSILTIGTCLTALAKKEEEEHLANLFQKA